MRSIERVVGILIGVAVLIAGYWYVRTYASVSRGTATLPSGQVVKVVGDGWGVDVSEAGSSTIVHLGGQAVEFAGGLVRIDSVERCVVAADESPRQLNRCDRVISLITSERTVRLSD